MFVKATVNYAGRDWVHGTTQTYQLQLVPKFHGLPGLVMMLKDRENVFSFIVNEVKKGFFY
jgi:GLPGLI family protein